MKPLSWKAVRRGDRYCAPACGRGCTWHEYQNAKRMAEDTLAMMKTKGWVARIHENLGWHWCLENKLCGMSLNYAAGLGFWTLMDDGDAKLSSSGSTCWTVSDKCFKDPNDAVEYCRRKVTPVFQAFVRGFFNLNSIFENENTQAHKQQRLSPNPSRQMRRGR